MHSPHSHPYYCNCWVLDHVEDMPRGIGVIHLQYQSGRLHSLVTFGGISIGRIVRLVRVYQLRHFGLLLVGWIVSVVSCDDDDVDFDGGRCFLMSRDDVNSDDEEMEKKE